MRFLRRDKIKGFTLIEIMVVIGIMSLLLTTTYTYSRSSEKQIAILRDQAKVVEIANRAKSLSLSSYGEEGAACGYGIHLEKPRTLIVFRDLAEDCATSDGKLIFSDTTLPCDRSNPDEECLEAYVLEQNVSFSDDTSITDIDFVPPDPEVIFSPDGLEEAIIKIKLLGTSIEKIVKINGAGQISAQ